MRILSCRRHTLTRSALGEKKRRYSFDKSLDGLLDLFYTQSVTGRSQRLYWDSLAVMHTKKVV